MRNVVLSALALPCGLSALLIEAGAQAAPPPNAGPRDDSQPIIIKHEQFGVSAAGDAARARARKGDCAGALEAFDQAIARSIDPTLRRDRGLCHERLGNPYPAIDDFRAYLTAMPDAPDSDDIRMRLERLEEQVGVGGPSAHKADEPGGVAGMKASVSIGDGKSDRYDSAKLDEAESDTPVRQGRGFMLTPYLGIRRWFAGNSVSSNLWAETVGLRINFWLNPVGSLFAELGYERFNTTQEDNATVSGLSSQIGYEARLPYRRDSLDNFWVLGLGVGYDALWITQTGSAGFSGGSASLAALLGRGRFGFRHNLSPRTGLEATFDGAIGRVFPIGDGTANGVTAGMLGLNVGLVFGL
jgi:hypothetical protein